MDCLQCFSSSWYLGEDRSFAPSTTQEGAPASIENVRILENVPEFLIIVISLYSFLWKGKVWEWTEEHNEVMKTLLNEL